jgi:hypothetical protein
MKQINLRLPDDIMEKFKAVIPSGKRNDFVVGLISREIDRVDSHLHRLAVEVENDKSLQKEMDEWGSTVSDGFEE